VHRNRSPAQVDGHSADAGNVSQSQADQLLLSRAVHPCDEELRTFHVVMRPIPIHPNYASDPCLEGAGATPSTAAPRTSCRISRLSA
jgi:hypothetical protein